MTRSCLLLALALLVPLASAQELSTEAQRASAQEVLVLSVIYQGDRYVYDLYGYPETEAVLYRAGAFIVRSESGQRVMAVLEPDSLIPATQGPNALFLSPAAPIGQFIPPPDDELDLAASEVTRHPVRVLLCADDDDGPFADPVPPGSACGNWVSVGPRSGGDGLDLIVVFGPELGGNRNRADDDG